MQDLATYHSLSEHACQVRQTLDQLRPELLAERCDGGWWEGELSPSALSTATAISALSAVVIHEPQQSSTDSNDSAATTHLRKQVRQGIQYLGSVQNDDGGYGDTDRSHSNIATSYLVLAADTLAQQAVGVGLQPTAREALQRYIHQAGEIAALRARYGKDKTFVVPIMTNLAIAGLFDWDDVTALPFEAAVFPQSMYRLLSIPVVSYAIPALVAIGQTRHFLGRKARWPLRTIRAASVSRTMAVLQRMQPESGGFLEATPLTSFVVMSLAVTGRGDHRVSRQGIKFLQASMTQEGSWPIDTNLATWVTSLAMQALANDPEDDGSWCTSELIDWHLSCQHHRRHPFTGAEPGGWGWSDLSGAVPDSDDTPAAILALCKINRWIDDEHQKHRVHEAMAMGCNWLQRLQNRDGGWPTFCRGWGKLPFDRSSNDLTAHALRAIAAFERTKTDTASQLGSNSKSNFKETLSAVDKRSVEKGIDFLQQQQQSDGSWLPLWFGNQDRPDEDNPVYGTSRVLATSDLGLLSPQELGNGCRYLLHSQNRDGGWGGGPSVSRWLRENSADISQKESAVESSMEETALAVEALASILIASEPAREDLNRDSSGDFSRETDADSAMAAEPDDRVLPRNPAGGDCVQLRDPEGTESAEAADLPSPGDRSSSKAREKRMPEPTGPGFGGTGDPSGDAIEQGLAIAGGKNACREAIIRGVDFLLRGVDRGQHRLAWPIGFYFAKLWYHERLYPLIFTTSALAKYLQWVERRIEMADSPPTARIET